MDLPLTTKLTLVIPKVSSKDLLIAYFTSSIKESLKKLSKR